MDNSLMGLIGVIVIVLIAKHVTVLLRRPLAILLKAEKGSEPSDFWSTYTRVLLLLVPATFALLSFPTGTYVNPLQALVSQLRWGLAGLVIALAITGKALRVPTPPRYGPPPFAPPIIPPPTTGPAR